MAAPKLALLIDAPALLGWLTFCAARNYNKSIKSRVLEESLAGIVISNSARLAVTVRFVEVGVRHAMGTVILRFACR